MHAVGLHSALAIRRERKRRAEQRRARERRYSQQSSESGLTSPHCSTGSLERRNSRRPRRQLASNQDSSVVTSMGMLHLGVVFLVLGIFLIGSGLLPDDVTSWSTIGSMSWWNELVCTGLFALGLGAFLIFLHKYITKNEEDALEEYVQRQLTRTRSGHKLERDAETGGMLTKNCRREMRNRRLEEKEFGDVMEPNPISPGLVKSPPPILEHGHGFVNVLALNGDISREPVLEQIAEVEEYSTNSERDGDDVRRMDTFNRETYSNNSTVPSLSPGTPSETKELLKNGRYMIMSRI